MQNREIERDDDMNHSRVLILILSICIDGSVIKDTITSQMSPGIADHGPCSLQRSINGLLWHPYHHGQLIAA